MSGSSGGSGGGSSSSGSDGSASTSSSGGGSACTTAVCGIENGPTLAAATTFWLWTSNGSSISLGVFADGTIVYSTGTPTVGAMPNCSSGMWTAMGADALTTNIALTKISGIDVPGGSVADGATTFTGTLSIGSVNQPTTFDLEQVSTFGTDGGPHTNNPFAQCP